MNKPNGYKAITDSPNLRGAHIQTCAGCKYYKRIAGDMNPGGVCMQYEFYTGDNMVCDSFETMPPPAPVDVPAMVESIAEAVGAEMPAPDNMMSYGGEIKSLSDGHIGGYLVRFGSPVDTDADGEYFDASTDYGFTKDETITTPVWLNHCQPLQASNGKAIAVREPIGQGTLKMMDDGIVIDAILYERKQYEKTLDMLGWSSGTADHTIKRKQNGKAIHIARWHLGLDASLTPKPGEPRNQVIAIKSLTTNPKAEPKAGVATPAAQATVTASDAVTQVLTQNAAQTAQEKQKMEKDQLDAALAPLTAKLDEQGKELANMKAILKAEPPKDNSGGIQVQPGQKYPYKSIQKVGTNYDMTGLGEQLQDIASVAKGHGVPARLVNAQDIAVKSLKALGYNEQVPSEGGFLVQHDNAGWLGERAFADSILAPKCQAAPIGAGANGVKFPDWDETSRVDGSHFGGMVAYWGYEAGTVTASTAKLREVDVPLQKLYALYYGTEELVEDATALAGRISIAFPRVMRWKLDNGIVRGRGNGEPIGMLNSAYTVSVSKETGQAAGSIVAENVEKMYARMLAYLLPGAEWYINQDCYPQLFQMAHTVGTGGVPVWIPPGGLSNAPYGSLLGRPVTPLEQCSTVGTVGDIVFANMNDYILAQKGTIQEASSIHVQFLTGQTAFRFMWRVNGQPAYSTALTPANGSNTLSAFVTLATRS